MVVMKKVGDILSDSHLREEPFKLPGGYVEELENRVSEQIGSKATGGSAWSVAKPAVLLAFMFVLIFGIGYATLSLTDTLNKGVSHQETAELPSTFELDDDTSDDIIDYLAQTLTLEDISSYAAEDTANQDN